MDAPECVSTYWLSLRLKCSKLLAHLVDQTFHSDFGFSVTTKQTVSLMIYENPVDLVTVTVSLDSVPEVLSNDALDKMKLDVCALDCLFPELYLDVIHDV